MARNVCGWAKPGAGGGRWTRPAGFLSELYQPQSLGVSDIHTVERALNNFLTSCAQNFSRATIAKIHELAMAAFSFLVIDPSVGSYPATTRGRHVGLLHWEDLLRLSFPASTSGGRPDFGPLLLSAMRTHTNSSHGRKGWDRVSVR